MVVVDNASGDDSVAVLEKAISDHKWMGWVHLIQNPLNGGFSYGNNQAIKQLLKGEQPADYIYLLNPDALVQAGAIAQLIEFMESHPAVGIAGSRIEEPQDHPVVSSFRFPTASSEFVDTLSFSLITNLFAHRCVPLAPSSTPMQVDWVSGAAMMLRGKTVTQIGLMDEGYFLYYEETDYCLRASLQGWQCWYVPASRVIHLAGQTTGVSTDPDRLARLPDYWFQSRNRFFNKNYGRGYAFVANILHVIASSAAYIKDSIRGRLSLRRPYALRDFLRNFFSVAGI